MHHWSLSWLLSPITTHTLCDLDTQGSVRWGGGPQSVDTYTGHIQVEKSSLWQQPAKAKAQNREKRSKRKSVQTHVWNKRECKTKINKQWKRWEKTDCCQSSITAYLCGTAEVIIIDLFYCLEVDHTLQLGLMFVCGKEKQRGFVLKTKTHWRQQTFLGMKSQGASLPRHLE